MFITSDMWLASMSQNSRALKDIGYTICQFLSSNGQRKYAPKSFSTIGPSNANFTMASATSQDAASALILSLAEMSSLLVISTKRL
jgi:hypothetical protein